jgi:hypothetical protein
MSAEERLRTNGVIFVKEKDVATHPRLKCLANKFNPTKNVDSLFVFDEDHNIIRLVNAV